MYSLERRYWGSCSTALLWPQSNASLLNDWTVGGSRRESKKAQEEDASFDNSELNLWPRTLVLDTVPACCPWWWRSITSIRRLSAHSQHWTAPSLPDTVSPHAAVDVCYPGARGSDVNTGGGGRQQIWECKSGVIQLARPQSTKPASIIGFLCCCCVPDSFRKDILPRESRLAARLLVSIPPSSPLPPLISGLSAPTTALYHTSLRPVKASTWKTSCGCLSIKWFRSHEWSFMKIQQRWKSQNVQKPNFHSPFTRQQEKEARRDWC